MSALTQHLRRELGNESYQDMKAKLYGSGVTAAIASMPQGGGSAPKATIEHQLKISEWQPLAVGAAILLITFYMFYHKG